MSDDSSLFLLLLGPAGGAALYWALYRYYRNTDKSHAFERETAVDVKFIHGEEHDHKVDEVRRTRDTHIKGNNLQAFRQRVQRVDHQADATDPAGPKSEP